MSERQVEFELVGFIWSRLCEGPLREGFQILLTILLSASSRKHGGFVGIELHTNTTFSMSVILTTSQTCVSVRRNCAERKRTMLSKPTHVLMAGKLDQGPE